MHTHSHTLHYLHAQHHCHKHQQTTTHTPPATPPAYTTQSHVHPTVGSSRDFNAPASLAATSPTTPTEQYMLSLIERLFHENDLLCKQVSDENDSLHRQVGELTTKLNVVKAQLASLTSTSPHNHNPATSWHEEAHTRIGATSAPTHAYHCAHHGYEW